MKLHKLLKFTVVIAIIGLIGLYFNSQLSSELSLESLKNHQYQWRELVSSNPLYYGLIYFLIYILVTTLSLPGATIMTLTGSALFGFWHALILVSFASSLGASLAFLISRFLLRDFFQQKYEQKLTLINKNLKSSGGYYLLSLRLLPIIPFFLINLLFGLTSITLKKYYFISQIGMLPSTILYVYAGHSLSQLQSINEILSPQMLFLFASLATFPLLMKFLLLKLNKVTPLSKK